MVLLRDFFYYNLSEYGGRDDEDVASREHDAAVLKKNLRENFEEAKFETGKLRNHYPPPLCSDVGPITVVKLVHLSLHFNEVMRPPRRQRYLWTCRALNHSVLSYVPFICSRSLHVRFGNSLSGSSPSSGGRPKKFKRLSIARFRAA